MFYTKTCDVKLVVLKSGFERTQPAGDFLDTSEKMIGYPLPRGRCWENVQPFLELGHDFTHAFRHNLAAVQLSLERFEAHV